MKCTQVYFIYSLYICTILLDILVILDRIFYYFFFFFHLSIFQDWSVTAIFARRPITRAKLMAIASPAPAWRTMWPHTLRGNVFAWIFLVNKIIIHHEKENIYIILSIHRFPTDQISYLASRSHSSLPSRWFRTGSFNATMIFRCLRID